MKIVVVSDSHHDLHLLEKIVASHPDASFYLHAGDSCRPEGDIHPYLSVRGNQDFHIKNDYRIIDAEGVKIYLFHGHRSFLSPMTLSGIAQNYGCQVIIHGHTHVPYYQIVNGIHILCPGSLAYPRTPRGTTYTIIDIDKDKNIKVKILDIK
ncbi:MAG: metallophosphoesterase [Bacilli bacterium]|nr:metallophosphoesterase [Bacilli bacterium]